MSAFLADFRRSSRREPCRVCGTWDHGCLTRNRDDRPACAKVPSDRPPLGTAPPTWLHGDDGPDWRDSRVTPTAISYSIMESGPPAPDPDLLDRGLRALLAACPPSEAHRADLRRRGLSDAEIDRLPFGSLLDRDAAAAAVIAGLGEAAYSNVPGLYRRLGRPALYAHVGLLVGVLQRGRLVGLVVRPDDEAVRAEGKYRHVSSRDRDGGCPSGAHCAVLPGEDDEVDAVVVTEGVLKGLIVNLRTGLPVVAMPGAGITSAVTGHLGELGARRAVLALDSDRLTNPNVAGAEATLIATVDAAGYPLLRLTWPARFKGLDDALAAGRIPIAEPVEAQAARPVEDPERLRVAEQRATAAESRQVRLVRAIQATGLAAPEKQSLVALFTHLEAARADEPRETVFAIPNSHVAEHVGVSDQTAGRHLDACQRLADAETGEIVELYRRRKDYDQARRQNVTLYEPRVTLDELIDFLPRAVPLTKDGTPKPKRGHGGPGDRFCPDHPYAPIVKRVTYHCGECDKEIDREPDSVESPTAISYSIMESGPDVEEDAPALNDHVPLGSVTSGRFLESG